ncbi:MAG: hypothetical protein VX768_17405 [Planctomycetota bacterium]|nr:hypothetical protein [Planctomycetota bacterium]
MDFVSMFLQPYNGLFTILMGTCICYWFLVVAGFFGMEVLEMDVEVDGGVVDGNFDVDVDPAEGADLGSVGMVRGFMRFMHFHEVPFMIVMTFVSTANWLMFGLLNYHWNTEQSWTFAMIWIVPTMIASLPVSKVALQPIVMLFRRVNIPEKKLGDYVGEECIVMTSEVNEKFGTAELSTSESPLVIQIRNRTAFKFSRGDRAVLTRYSGAGKYFEIGPVDKKNT